MRISQTKFKNRGQARPKNIILGALVLLSSVSLNLNITDAHAADQRIAKKIRAWEEQMGSKRSSKNKHDDLLDINRELLRLNQRLLRHDKKQQGSISKLKKERALKSRRLENMQEALNDIKTKILYLDAELNGLSHEKPLVVVRDKKSGSVIRQSGKSYTPSPREIERIIEIVEVDDEKVIKEKVEIIETKANGKKAELVEKVKEEVAKNEEPVKEKKAKKKYYTLVDKDLQPEKDEFYVKSIYDRGGRARALIARSTNTRSGKMFNLPVEYGPGDYLIKKLKILKIDTGFSKAIELEDAETGKKYTLRVSQGNAKSRLIPAN